MRRPATTMSANPAPMRYEEFSPPADLAPWVAAFWSFEVAPGAGEMQHPIPLTGGAILAIRPGEEPVLTGPRVQPLIVPVQGGDVHLGVHLLPGAAGALLCRPVAALRDHIGPARFVLDPDWCAGFTATANPAEHLIESVRALASAASEPDPVVMAAVRTLLATGGAEPIARLSFASGLSARQFRRRFTEAVGLSPKELARLRRIRAVAAAAVMEGGSWAEAAAEHGFADQAHLVREFRSLLGRAPRAFQSHAQRIVHRLV